MSTNLQTALYTMTVSM